MDRWARDKAFALPEAPQAVRRQRAEDPAQARTQLRRARLHARVWWEVAGSEQEG